MRTNRVQKSTTLLKDAHLRGGDGRLPSEVERLIGRAGAPRCASGLRRQPTTSDPAKNASLTKEAREHDWHSHRNWSERCSLPMDVSHFTELGSNCR